MRRVAKGEIEPQAARVSDTRRMRLETPADAYAVARLLDRSFGPDRAARISYRLRAERAPVADLCRVVEDDDGRLLACLGAWEAAVGEHRLLLLGPFAVESALRGRGIGKTLLAETLAAARRARRWPAALLVGDSEYFAPFGFRPAAEYGLALPNALASPRHPLVPARFLALELHPHALAEISGLVQRA